MMRMNEFNSAASGVVRSELERVVAAALEQALRGRGGETSENAVKLAAIVGGSVATAIINLSPRQHRALSATLKNPSKLAPKIVRLLLADAAQETESTSARGQLDSMETSAASQSEMASDSQPQRGGLASALIEDWAGQVAGSTYLEETLRIPRSTLHRWQRRGEVSALRTGGRKHVFPLAQFVDGRPVPGIREVLQLIGHPRTAWSWLIRPAAEFDGEAPIDLLTKDRSDDVIRAAAAVSASTDQLPQTT